MVTSISLKRVYDPIEDSDGHRVLVDRLWPRGMRRDHIAEGAWLWEIAPSAGLRTWYGHEKRLFEEFEERYRAELDSSPVVDRLLATDGQVTLLTATRDVATSHAAVLRDYLKERLVEET